MPRLRVNEEYGTGFVVLPMVCVLVIVLYTVQTVAVYSEDEDSNPRPQVARLEIARVGVSGGIEEGFDAKTLDTAIGLLPQGARPGEPGNMILAGHRDTYFAGLRDARAGDLVVVRQVGGRRYKYRVVKTFLAAATDSLPLRSTPGQRMLTLITCYPFRSIGDAPPRLVVQAEADDVHRFYKTVI